MRSAIYAHTFLNGILLFAWNGKKAELIAKKKWGGCNYLIYDKHKAKSESIMLLSNYLDERMKLQSISVNKSEQLSFSEWMIYATRLQRVA